MKLNRKMQARVFDMAVLQTGQSFNIAILSVGACVVTSVAGIFLVYSGKTTIGVAISVSGLIPVGTCIKFHHDVTNRLDEWIDESGKPDSGPDGDKGK
jgi:hypothetical protein